MPLTLKQAEKILKKIYEKENVDIHEAIQIAKKIIKTPNINWDKVYENMLAYFLEEQIKDYKAKRGIVWENKEARKQFENMINKHFHLFKDDFDNPL